MDFQAGYDFSTDPDVTADKLRALIEDASGSNVSSADMATGVKTMDIGTADPTNNGDFAYNTDRLLALYRHEGVDRKLNMFKKPLTILDGEDYGELIRLGGEIDYDKDGTAEFASTDISNTQYKYGSYSMKFDSAQVLTIPCTNRFTKENGSLAFWVYGPSASKVLYENFAGWKIATDGSQNVDFSITESNVTLTAKTVNTISGTTSIASGWHHVLVTWSNINSGSANGAMSMYIDGILNGTAISATQIDAVGGHTNQIIGAGRGNPTWTKEYNADDIPGNDGWTPVGTAAYGTVANGILTIDNVAASNCYYEVTGLSNDDWTIEAKARIESITGSFNSNKGIVIGATDIASTTEAARFNIYVGSVAIVPTSTGAPFLTSDDIKTIPLDTTKYHVYRITNDSTSGIRNFYIDGVLVHSSAQVADQVNEIAFGNRGPTSGTMKSHFVYMRYCLGTAQGTVSDQCGGYIDEFATWDHTMNAAQAKSIEKASESLYDYYEISKKDYIVAHEKSPSESFDWEEFGGDTLTSSTETDLPGFTAYVNSPGDQRVRVTVNLEVSTDDAADRVQSRIAIDGFGVPGERTWDFSEASARKQLTYVAFVGLQKGVNDIAIQANNDGTNTLTIHKGSISIEGVK